MRLTDSGRTVYGGGGISPDVKFAEPKSNRFQDSLLQHYAFFNFAKHYMINHTVPKNFAVDEQVVNEFRRYLDDQKVPYTEADFVQNDEWVKNNIKSELFISQFGQQAGLQVRAESDPQVLKALELLPKAKELADNARRIIAEHGGKDSTQ